MIYFDIETTGLDCCTEGKESAEISKIEAIRASQESTMNTKLRLTTRIRKANQ